MQIRKYLEKKNRGFSVVLKRRLLSASGSDFCYKSFCFGNTSIPDGCYLIADKYGISNRALTELAAGFLAPGSNIDDFNLSVKTTERMRNKVRSENAKAYKTNQLNNQDETFYTLHWDSKRMKSLSHTQADKERIAVVLTGW